MVLLSIISLLGMYLSSNFTLARIACLAVGVTSVIPQLLLPLCAKLSDEYGRELLQRGKPDKNPKP